MMKRLIIALFVLLVLNGCSSIYYRTMEKFGHHKRDILVERVTEARDSQFEVKEQFASALEQYKSVLGFDGGELEDKYSELKDVLEDCEERAAEVHRRNVAVEEVAEDLFDEWENELDQYSSKRMRALSQQQLKATRGQYYQLIGAMKRAEAKIAPVLDPLRDQVLFLKHNLNARAISSLQVELQQIETDVARLVRDMNASISEADHFINDLRKE